MRSAIEMAKEAGFMLRAESVKGQSDWWECFDEAIEKLVALARADERDRAMRENAYVQAEREACAKFCETHQVWVGQGKRGFSEWGEEEFVTGGIHQGMDYAAAIRARGNT